MAQHQHTATIRWQLTGDSFLRGRYSRAHQWEFDGGVTVAGSPSPSVVPSPWSDPSAVDPEEAFVAALASCHMLTFLYLASKAGFVVTSYMDEARGLLTKNERGIPWVSEVVLSPRHGFSGDKLPTDAELDVLHEQAHEGCFIANSVKTALHVQWSRI